MLCTHCEFGSMYMRCCVHIVQVMLCTCGVVYMFLKWFHVHVMLCTCCVGGILYRWYYVHVVHVVFCVCSTCVFYMWYYVHVVHVVLITNGIVLCALYSHYIMTCVIVVYKNIHIYTYAHLLQPKNKRIQCLHQQVGNP